MRTLTTLIASTIIAIVQAMACDCGVQKDINYEFGYSKSIVVGKIMAKEHMLVTDSILMKLDSLADYISGRTIMKYTLVIDERIKGNFTTDTIDVYTGMNDRDCGILFIIGVRYLIYGIDGTYNGRVFTDNNKSLWTINCLRTKRADITEIKELRQLAKE